MGKNFHHPISLDVEDTIQMFTRNLNTVTSTAFSQIFVNIAGIVYAQSDTLISSPTQ